MGTVVGHSGGMGWDEALLFALPVAILGVLQLVARRKARDAGDGDEDGGGGQEGGTA